MKPDYIPSRLLDIEGALLREHAFTAWMSRDPMQTAVDFLRNIGLLPIYAETAKEGSTRYLCWKAPKDWGCEVRSGRTLEQFLPFDARNKERGWPLLTLHISDGGIYSAVWLAPNHFETAQKVLAGYAITLAARPGAG